MNRLIGLILLASLIYGGYLFYQQSNLSVKTTSDPIENQGSLILTQTSDKLGSLAAVLGASVSNTFENGKELLSNATDGASEPIINQLVTKTQETLKDLPRKEAEKIKYEFCKGVVVEFENKSEQTVKE